MSVSGNLEELQALMADQTIPLHPDLEQWVEDGDWGPMLRSPLVYEVPLFSNGVANRVYEQKRKMLSKAEAKQDWATVIWLHERPHRMNALVDYVIGRNDHDEVLPLVVYRENRSPSDYQDMVDLVADVWVDSENIQQNIEEWRQLFGNGEGLWIGTDDERREFMALPWIEHKDGPLVRAYRGGAVGDWSWTTDKKVAEFFSRRSGHPVRGHLIPVSDVFGYLTRRGEAELLVKFTEFRRDLVYPC